METSSSNLPLSLGLISALAVFVGIATGAWWLKRDSAPQLDAIFLIPAPRTIYPFELAGSDGAPFTNENLKGHWSLLYAGYTYCPDVCPTTLTQLKALQSELGTDASHLRIVFISVDPQRDTPEKLNTYVHYFSPDFAAATGTDAQLDKLGANIGIAYQKQAGTTALSYSVDHSAHLILIDPKGRLRGYVSPPFDTKAIAKDLRWLFQNVSP